MIFPREYAEWNDFWWEKAGDPHRRRVLLIGDSITRSYRDRVQEIMKPRRIAVDKLCGSRCAGDPILTAEIDLMTGPLNGYRYDVIHFNNGLHGGCNDTRIPLDVYEKGIRDIVAVLRRNQPDAKLILVTSTPMSAPGTTSIEVKPENNVFVHERNDFLRRFAAENSYAVDDLYALVANSPDFPKSDNVHFTKDAAARIGDRVAEFVERYMESV
ncbi:MAG: SGNH/GDSL hydrolase family protein [Clostridia bacterium]|nr:SGNH/GDSL hydrolase family protein [Clostridia bacterium]